MTLRSRAPRIALTAGMRGWARIPYDPDRDPSLPPDTTHLENVIHMTTDHTLTPADIAARCDVLGCGVVVHGANYKITPPADATTEDGSRPSVVHIPADADFRSKADRTLSIRNLRHNGVDVLQDRDWSGKADTTPDPTPEIPKMAPIPGGRPNATWTGPAHDDADEPELENTDQIITMLAAEMHRIVEPIAEDVAKLGARIDALESRPAPAGTMRLGQLDSSVGSLARRVTGLEEGRDALADGLATARTALGSLNDRLSSVTRAVTEHGQRLDALATGTAPAAPAESAWIPEMRAQATEVLASFGHRFLGRVNIAEDMGLDTTDPDSADMKHLSYVLKLMRADGSVETTGSRASIRYRLAQTPEKDA